MPVEGVCYAGLEDISKLGKKVLAEHFPTGDVPETTVSKCVNICRAVLAIWCKTLAELAS